MTVPGLSREYARLQLRGQVAVVTGGGRGIGRACVHALAAAGATAVAVARNSADLDAVVAEVAAAGGEAVGLSRDVRRAEDMRAMAADVEERYGRIDALVACAGVLRGGRPVTVASMPVGEWDLVVGTNLRGVFLSNQAVLPAMQRQRRGTIINLSSTSGRTGLAYDAAYCASKFGVIGFSESLAEEVRPYGIKVQTVLPGAVDTKMWQQNGPLPRPAAILPAQRVADLVVYLLSLPEDTALVHPTIVSFQSRSTPRRRPDTSENAAVR